MPRSIIEVGALLVIVMMVKSFLVGLIKLGFRLKGLFFPALPFQLGFWLVKAVAYEVPETLPACPLRLVQLLSRAGTVQASSCSFSLC